MPLQPKASSSQTYLDHSFFVGNSPPRLLRIIVDRHNGVEIGRIRIDFPVDVVGLELSLECKLRCAQLRV